MVFEGYACNRVVPMRNVRSLRLLNVQSTPPVMGAYVIATIEKCVAGSMGRAWPPGLLAGARGKATPLEPEKEPLTNKRPLLHWGMSSDGVPL